MTLFIILQVHSQFPQHTSYGNHFVDNSFQSDLFQGMFP